jgi:hypothetical protein
MSVVTTRHKELYTAEGFMTLPGVIPRDTLEMLREQCSYHLGYSDSMLDARGMQSDDIIVCAPQRTGTRSSCR